MAMTVIFAGPDADETDAVVVNGEGLTGGTGATTGTTTQGALDTNEVQRYSLGGDYPPTVNYANGGTFTITFDGQTTAPIPYYTSPVPYLEALPNINPGDVSYTGNYWASNGTNMPTLTFGGQYAGVNVPEITLDTSALTYVAAGSPSSVVTVTQGAPGTNEVQTVSTGGATSGSYQLSYGGEYTAPIAYDATAAQVQSALEALTVFAPGDVVVTGGSGEYTVTFGGAYAREPVDQMGVSSSGTTGGTGSPTTTVETAAAPVDPGTLIPYRIVVRSAAGTRYGELAGFDFKRATWELSGMGFAEFSLPETHPSALLIPLATMPSREVEIWRGFVLVWAGPIVRAESDGVRVNVQCVGLEWYFKRRHTGKADRTNYLANPQFEDSGVGTFPALWGTGNVTATVVDTHKVLGARAVELWQTNADVDTHIHQQVFFNTGPLGLFVTLAAWFFIRPDVAFEGPAFEERGLFIEVRDAANNWTHYEYVPINEETPRGVWNRGEVGIHLPPNTTGYSVDARCYAIGGRIVWDAASLTVMESLSFYDTEQTTIAAALVAHAQDPAYGKSDLSIGTSTTATGIRRTRHYQHVDHLPISEALAEWEGLKDGFEWEVVVSEASRLFTTYFPRKSRRRYDISFTLGPAYGPYFGTIVSYRLQADAETTANVVIVPGEGEGPDREEGAAQDVAFLDGLTLEAVIFPPAGSNIDRLDALAHGALERLKRTVTVLSMVVKDPALIGSLHTGDVVTVVIDHGWTQVNGLFRVVSIELDPNNETLTLSLNPAELYDL